MSSISDIVAAQATFLSDLKDATDSLVSLNNRVYSAQAGIGYGDITDPAGYDSDPAKI